MTILVILLSLFHIPIQKNEPLEFRVYVENHIVSEGELFLFRAVVVNNTNVWIQASNIHSFLSNKCIQLRNLETKLNIGGAQWAEGCTSWPESIPPKDSIMDLYIIKGKGVFDSLGRVWYLPVGQYELNLTLYWRYEDDSEREPSRAIDATSSRIIFIDTLTVIERTQEATESFMASREIAKQSPRLSLDSLYSASLQMSHYRFYLRHIISSQCGLRPAETIPFVYAILEKNKISIDDPSNLLLVRVANSYLWPRKADQQRSVNMKTELTSKILAEFPVGNFIRLALETNIRNRAKRMERKQ